MSHTVTSEDLDIVEDSEIGSLDIEADTPLEYITILTNQLSSGYLEPTTEILEYLESLVKAEIGLSRQTKMM
jgi:hypothetical protein